jgi:ABC-type multidrug transport system fused ATPase/permease subunit
MNTAIVLPPIYLGRLIDAATAGLGPGWSRLFPPMTAFSGALLLYNLPRIGKRYWLRVMANRMNCRLRSDLLRAVFAYPLARCEGERVGDVMSRAIGDVQVFADTVQFVVTELYDTVLMMMASFVALLVMEPRLTLVSSAPVPLALLFARLMGPRVFARALATRQASAALSEHLHQRISGVRVLRLLGLEEILTRSFDQLSRRLQRAHVSLELLQAGLVPLYATVAALGVVWVIGQGGLRVAAGLWTVGTFSAYVTLFGNMAMRVLVGARMITRGYAGASAWSRIDAKLDVAGSLGPVPGSPAGTLVRHHRVALAASGLGMSFPGQREPALGSITFTVPAGSWVGITGPVGAGKSALGLVMAGLYPYTGSLTINGQELSSLSVTGKVANIGYLGQAPFLFSAPVLENICLDGAAAPDQDRLGDAIFGAALEDDVAQFPQGLATPVGELGVQVSGGQRQRIALARALYQRPPVLILDDPFSAVDPVTERIIVSRLRALLVGTTVVIMSHRLVAFAWADQVLVLDEGLVLQRGTHQELADTGGLYRRIPDAQTWIAAQEARP